MASWFDSVNRFSDPLNAARAARFLSLLDRFPTGHVVDLGAGHGAFSRLAVQRGWQVTAVDARDARFGTETDIRWVVQDIREFDEYDDVDLVVCLGLWYHLSPEDQVGLAARVHPRPVILDTHVALPTQALPAHEVKMSGPVAVGGYRGRFYDESGFEARSTASWGNRKSFWPDLPSLEQQFFDAGYDTFEVVSPAYLADRTFFVVSTLGDAATTQRLDDDVARQVPLANPDAAPTSSHSFTLARPITLERVRPHGADPTPPRKRPTKKAKPPSVATASADLGRALLTSGRRRTRKLTRAVAARRAGQAR